MRRPKVSKARRLNVLEGGEPKAEEALGGIDARQRSAEGTYVKMVGPVAKREAVAHLRGVLQMSTSGGPARWLPPESQDDLLSLTSSARYRAVGPSAQSSQPTAPVLLSSALHPVAGQELSGLNRIYRLYREEGLAVRKRRSRCKAVWTRRPIFVEAKPRALWSLDFVQDQLACGRCFRILNIVDDVTRECLMAIPDTSISGKRVARELTALIEGRSKLKMIVSDNGTEFTSNAISSWLAACADTITATDGALPGESSNRHWNNVQWQVTGSLAIL